MGRRLSSIDQFRDIYFFCQLLTYTIHLYSILYMEKKASGFASPTQGYEEQNIDLNGFLVDNPPATYYMRLESGEMTKLGLPEGSLLVVDRSKNPVHNSFVIIRHEGQFYCRLMLKEGGRAVFSNGETAIIPGRETEIFGTITASIKKYDNFSH